MTERFQDEAGRGGSPGAAGNSGGDAADGGHHKPNGANRQGGAPASGYTTYPPEKQALVVKTIMALFDGHPDLYGYAQVTKAVFNPKKNKWEFAPGGISSVRAPLTAEMVHAHLAGEDFYGCTPLHEKGLDFISDSISESLKDKLGIEKLKEELEALHAKISKQSNETNERTTPMATFDLMKSVEEFKSKYIENNKAKDSASREMIESLMNIQKSAVEAGIRNISETIDVGDHQQRSLWVIRPMERPSNHHYNRGTEERIHFDQYSDRTGTLSTAPAPRRQCRPCRCTPRRTQCRTRR
jgi:hypothetical protein